MWLALKRRFRLGYWRADVILLKFSPAILPKRRLALEVENLSNITPRAPIADLKRLMESDPKLDFAIRTVVEKVKNGELTTEDIIVKLSKRKSRA